MSILRRVPLILGLALLATLTVEDIREFFVTNEGIRYLSSEPQRLLYVMGLGVAGGMVALGVSRLSAVSQRRLKLTALLAGGISLTVALLSCLIPAAAFLARDVGNLKLIAGAVASFAVVGGLLCWEFFRVWRRAAGTPRSGARPAPCRSR